MTSHESESFSISGLGDTEHTTTFPNSANSKSKRRLTLNKSETKSESAKQKIQETQATEQCETPLQKYISSCQTKIDDKLEAKRKLVEEKEMFDLKINDAKSINAGKGSLCHNCHLRLGHTARNCVLKRCQNIHSCGQDKLHPADLAKRR